MAYRTALKIAMVERGIKQQDLAFKLGIHESRFSRIVRGYADASDQEQRQLARILRKPVEVLFAETAA